MKKLITITFIVLFIFVSNAAYAKGNKVKMPSFKYKGAQYTLYYAAKSKETGGFINEYYKPRESYTSWTELMAIHHYPASKNPIKLARAFNKYVKTRGLQVFIDADSENHTAVVDFVMVDDKRLPIILEYNIFRFEQNTVCGTQAVQYAKRYLLSNALIVDKVLRDIEKTRLKQIKAFKKLETPELIAREIDRGVYITKQEDKPVEKVQTKPEKQEKAKKNKKEFVIPDPFTEFFGQSEVFADKVLAEEDTSKVKTEEVIEPDYDYINQNPCDDFFGIKNGFEYIHTEKADVTEPSEKTETKQSEIEEQKNSKPAEETSDLPD